MNQNWPFYEPDICMNKEYALYKMIPVMKKWMVFLLSFMLVSCVRTFQPIASMSEDLKVMSWNIGHKGKYASEFHKVCESVVGVVKSTGTDILLLVEAYGADRDIAEKLDFYCETLSGNLTVLSKYPIEGIYNFRDKISSSNFGGVLLNVNGRLVRIFNVWLNDQPDISFVPTYYDVQRIIAWEKTGRRDEDISIILNLLRPYISEKDEIPIIVGGYFNSHSYLDWTEDTKYMFQHNGAVVDWPVSRSMANHGFIDSFRQINPDPITNLGVTWMYADSLAIREDRIDYIYYQGKHLEVVESDSYYAPIGKDLYMKGKYYFYGSDHGFVLTTFKYK